MYVTSDGNTPAEVERLDARGVVHVLQLGVGLKDIQNRPVRLPEELEPRNHHLAIGAFLFPLLRHGGKHDALGSGLRFQVSHLGGFHQGQLGHGKSREEKGQLSRKSYMVQLSHKG